ncbi:hypothetical protein HBN50_10815 [Halobacteriovorax sp. GB3]|uniref:hypothetical protein n=1 Tax=Halobacteriovorax sp. GB3 TaxID=2719615 RepID=UPI002362F786|nr:hypothetical protein [Halobacteriovorax sp. GB3]MDD0853594.1 hypothetical protein [Halobacteriovorax sp. GB3]
MRYLFLFMALFFIVPSFACNKSVDPNKVVLFIDVNASHKEILAARKGACERGESLRVIPEGSEKLGKANLDYLYTLRMSTFCYDTCEEWKKKNEKVQLKLNRISQNVEKDLKVSLRKELEKLEKEGKTVESLLLSGHNSGGSFSSDDHLGNRVIEKGDINNIFKDFPKQAESVKSVLLLGCYTGVKKEILDWKAIFDNANLILGYNKEGPLSDRPSASTMVEDGLVFDKKINDLVEDKKLRRSVEKNFRHLIYVNGAIYFKPQCSEANGYYYQSDLKGNKRLEEFSTADCEENARVLGDGHKEQLLDYYYGRKAIPEDTSDSPLREIYSFTRKYSYCYEINPDWDSSALHYKDPDRILQLLFFNKMKINFAKAYKEDIDLFDDLLEGFDPSYRIAELKEAARQLEIEIKGKRDLISKIKKKDKTLIKSLEDDIAELDQLLIEAEMAGLDKEEVSIALKNLRDKEELLSAIEGEGTDYIIQGYENSIADSELKINSLANSVVAAKGLKDYVKKNYWKMTPENLENKSRKEILDNVHALTYIANATGQHSMHQFARAADKRLNELNSIPFEWHDFISNPRKPADFLDEMNEAFGRSEGFENAGDGPYQSPANDFFNDRENNLLEF